MNHIRIKVLHTLNDVWNAASTTESFTTASAIPPQGAGYIELVCMVPTTWQQIGVTYTPTFVSGKTLNFTINASDLTKA